MAEIKTLGLSGFDREDELAFRELFDRAETTGWRIVPEAEAGALLIDFDSMYGQMAWLKGQGSGRPTAALTAAARADTDYLLQRPISIESLGALLKAMAAGVPTTIPSAAGATAGPAVTSAGRQAQGEPADAEPVAAAPQRAPAPEPAPVRKRTLIDFLQPKALPGPVSLADAEPLLAVDLAGDTYIGGSALKPLAVHCHEPIEAARWHAVTPAEYERLKSEHGSQPLNRLRWLAGLHGHAGTLCPALRDATRFKLVKWPQSEREFPKHFRVATALLKQPGSRADLAAASGSSQAEVADFINACHAIGMIEADGPGTGSAAEAKPGLMGRLRGKS
jgi:hypothetical protein